MCLPYLAVYACALFQAIGPVAAVGAFINYSLSGDGRGCSSGEWVSELEKAAAGLSNSDAARQSVGAVLQARPPTLSGHLPGPCVIWALSSSNVVA